MKKTIQRLRNERGLTLVELLAVIVILAIVAVIAFVMIGNVMENARQDAHIPNAQQMIAAAKLYDATEEQITTIDTSKLHEKGYLDVLINPWSEKSGDEEYKGSVEKTKEDDVVVFKATITGKEIKDCEMTSTKEEDLAKGRDVVCKN